MTSLIRHRRSIGWLLPVVALAGCVRAGSFAPLSADAGDSTVADAPGDAVAQGDAGAPGAVGVSALEVGWSTPHWVYWTWRADGVAGDLAAFELVIAETAGEVVARVGSSVRIERYELSLDAAAGLERAGRAMTGQLVPATTYFGQLVALDTEGRRAATAVVEARTTAVPSREIVIFADEQTEGYSIPGDLVRSTRAPYSGTHHYEWVAACAEPPCYEILRRQDLRIALDPIDRQSFETTAFFEVALASNSTVPWQTRLRVWFGTAADHEGLLTEFGYWPVPTDDAYHVYEVPVRALNDSDVPVSYETVVRGLYELAVDGTWSAGALVRLDEWRIRW